MKCVGVPEPQCWGNDVIVNSGLCKHLLISYSRVWKRASGERPSCELVLIKRGESFNFTHPGRVRKRCSGPGQARDLEASTDSEHRPRGTTQRLAFGFCLLIVLFVHTCICEDRESNAAEWISVKDGQRPPGLPHRLCHQVTKMVIMMRWANTVVLETGPCCLVVHDYA